MKGFLESSLLRGWKWMTVLALCAGYGPGSAHAQAVATATRSIGISVFGGYSQIAPDFGPPYDIGYFIGGDISRHFRIVDVSIEPRYGWTSGNTITQNYFLGNVKFEKALGRGDRFHPFAAIGIGVGKINYGYLGFPNDSSTIKVLSGGLDYDVIANFGIKAEYQYQFWNFGESDTLTPHGFNVGIVYRLHSIPFMKRH